MWPVNGTLEKITGNNCHSWTCGNDCCSWFNNAEGSHSWKCGNNCSEWEIRLNNTGGANWSCGNNCNNWTLEADGGNNWSCGNNCNNWVSSWSSNWSCGNNCNGFDLYLSLSKGLACGDNCSYWKCRNGAISYFTILSGTSGTASSLLNIPAVYVYGGDCLDVIVGKDINNRVIAYPAISTENSYISDVSLFCVDKGEVFLKVPKNTMTHNDRVIIARYIRNK
jgi:hypothetical protein